MSTYSRTPVSFFSACLALGLLLALGVTTLVDLLDGPGDEREERVAKTPTPPFSIAALKRYPGDTRFYLQKRYAFKDQFIVINTVIKQALFGHTPVPKVMVGQNGFLFLNNDSTVALVQGADFPKPADETKWARYFTSLQTAFDAKNLPFVFVLAPNKHSIYGEALPDWLLASHAEHNFTDRVLSQAQTILYPEPLDLRLIFRTHRAAAPTKLLYHRTDTHWNELGAAVAMRAVLTPLGIDFPEPIATVVPAGMGGDLARMLGRQHQLIEHTPIVPRHEENRCKVPNNSEVSLITLDPLPHRRFTCVMPRAEPRTALVFMDSFGVGTVPTLSQIFEKSHFVFQDAVDIRLVDELMPDLVIQILAERKVQTIDPSELLLGTER